MTELALPTSYVERHPLPPVCAVTGRPAVGVHPVTRVKAPAWTYLLLLLGLLPFVVVYYAAGTKVRVPLPVPAGFRRRRALLYAAVWVGWVVAPFAVLGGIEDTPVALLVGAVAVVGAVWAGLRARALLPRVRFDGATVRLRAHPAFVAAVEAARSAVPAAWYPDPAGRYEHRWWDGTAWTDRVATAGVAGSSPLG